MTRLGRASALLGVFAGDYAILRLCGRGMGERRPQSSKLSPH